LTASSHFSDSHPRACSSSEPSSTACATTPVATILGTWRRATTPALTTVKSIHALTGAKSGSDAADVVLAQAEKDVADALAKVAALKAKKKS